MSSPTYLSDLFQNLPQPYTLTHPQIKIQYQSFYRKLHESYESNNFIKINDLLNNFNLLSPLTLLKYPYATDNLAADLIKLLYQIITTYPIKCYMAQFLAAKFLDQFLEKNDKIPELTFEWHPFYKVFYYYLYKTPFLVTKVNKRNISKTFYSLSNQISRYFSNETNLTDQLLKKFLPHNKLYFLKFIIPSRNGSNEFYFKYIFNILKTNPNRSQFLPHIFNSIKNNIEDDFTCILPFVSQYISDAIVKDLINDDDNMYNYLNKIICLLFISPPTRKKIIELFESFMQSFKTYCHPSSKNSESVSEFIENIVIYLFNYLNKNHSIWPSNGEFHQLLSMTSSINRMNISNICDSSQILYETKFDPLLIDPYFEIGIQCINSVDPISIAKSGWFIMNGLISSIEKSEIIQENFQSLFQTAIDMIHINNLQKNISIFISIAILKVPFNKDKTIQSLQNVNFEELLYSYFTKIISIIRTLSTNKDDIMDEFRKSILIASNVIFKNCDISVLNEIFPIFSNLVYDNELIETPYIIEHILRIYATYISNEQCNKIIKSIQKEIELENLTSKRLRYLLIIYSTLLTSNLKTIEAAKQTIDFIIPFTENKDKDKRKAAWEALINLLSLPKHQSFVDVTLKKEMINNNYAFETGSLEDFDFHFLSKLDLTDLIIEVVDSIYNKLLTLTDPQEILNIIKDTDEIELILNQESTDIDDNDYQMIKKSLPIMNKFFLCADRLLRNFSENDKIVFQILLRVPFSLNRSSNNFLNSIKNSILDFGFDYEKRYNSEYLNLLLKKALNIRKKFLLQPITTEFSQLIERVINLSFSKSSEIQEICIDFLNDIYVTYAPFVHDKISNIVKSKINNDNFEQLLFFISHFTDEIFFLKNADILCNILKFLLANLHLNDSNISNYNEFFTKIVLSSLPIGTDENSKRVYSNFMKEIECHYLTLNPINKTYHRMLLHIILMLLKNIDECSDVILDFVLKNLVHYDEKNSNLAQICFIYIMKRRIKFTKEKVKIDKNIKISDFPNILNQVSVEYPKSAFFFPCSLDIINEEGKDLIKENKMIEKIEMNVEDCGDLIDEFEEEEEEFYSLESNTPNSLDVNYGNVDVNQDILNVFTSFKCIKIHWESNELFEHLNYSSYSHINKESYSRKTHEFINNELLIKSMKNIFNSAINSINEKNEKNVIHYSELWELYSLTVGPFCLEKLNSLTKEFLSKYFEVSLRITSKILSDMIIGFMKGIHCWNVDDRIKFFKLIFLPVIFVFLSGPSSFSFAKMIIMNINFHNNPYPFAPIIKVLYDLSDYMPSNSDFNYSLRNILVLQVTHQKMIFFNSFDQYKEKFIDHFIDDFNECNTAEIDNVTQLLFCFLEISSISNQNTIIYSNEVEHRKMELIQIFNEILNIKVTNEKMKKSLFEFIYYSFYNFIKSTTSVKLLLKPILINHLHIIFELLNGLNINNEEDFIFLFSLFIEDELFLTSDELKFNFVSSLIKELMNSSLPMQLTLLENLNTLIERNIFNIQKIDYCKFEEEFLKYNRHVISKNLGNELSLKIAKILGIFEIRNFTFDKIKKDFNIEDKLLICGSIVLNTFLFDKVDENVIKSLEFMVENYTPKNKEFYETALEIFVRRNANHVINEANELIMKYSLKLKPSYFS